MQPFIPIFINLLNAVTLKTESIDSPESGASDSISSDDWNGFSPRNNDAYVHSADQTGLKAFLGYYHKMDSESLQYYLRNWNKSGTKFSILESRPVATIHNNTEDAINDLDEMSETIDESPETEPIGHPTFVAELVNRPSRKSPVVIINKPPFSLQPENLYTAKLEKADIRRKVSKKSRYHNANSYKHRRTRFGSNYEDDGFYLCMPNRNDVAHLLDVLVGHRQRSGMSKVHICNRRRTPRTLLTNVRFIGRRRK